MWCAILRRSTCSMRSSPPRRPASAHTSRPAPTATPRWPSWAASCPTWPSPSSRSSHPRPSVNGSPPRCGRICGRAPATTRPPPALSKATARRRRAEAAGREAAAPAAEPVDLAAARATRATRGPRPAWRWLLEAAAVIALVGVVGWNVLLQGQLDAARQQAALLSSALATAAQAGSVTATLQGSGPAAAASGFVVAGTGGTNYMVVSGLPDPGAGRHLPGVVPQGPDGRVGGHVHVGHATGSRWSA